MSFGFDTLPEDKKIILSVSGGRDSTAMSLELWDYMTFHQLDLDILLMYEQTGFNSSYATRTVKELQEKTGWPLEVVRYQGEQKPIQILRESFKKIPEALTRLDEGKKEVKNLFRCCTVLKKKPYHEFIRRFAKDEIIIVVGLKGKDGALHRRYRMRQLRDLDTYFRTKSDGYTYFYPLRDASDKDVRNILRRFNMAHVKSSGCVMCPFFLIYDMGDKDAERRSRYFAKLNGIEPRMTNQPPLRAFCAEEADQ